jgi:hypothetical protein
MTRPDPSYDLIAAIDRYAPGLILQRAVLDGVAAAYVAGGYVPVTQAQVLAVTGPLPVAPTSLRRFADSNPDPMPRK